MAPYLLGGRELCGQAAHAAVVWIPLARCVSLPKPLCATASPAIAGPQQQHLAALSAHRASAAPSSPQAAPVSRPLYSLAESTEWHSGFMSGAGFLSVCVFDLVLELQLRAASRALGTFARTDTEHTMVPWHGAP
jgi:hypothetical protein